MDWATAKDLLLGSMGTAFFAFFLKELHELRKSIEHLNIKIATMIERTVHHESTIAEHAKRLRLLERDRS